MAQVPSNLIPTRITQLPDAPVASQDGLLLYVYGGSTYKIRAGDLLSVSGVPTSRQVIAGTSLQGGGALSANVTLSVAPAGVSDTELSTTGVTAGSYGDASTICAVTVNAQGRVTTVSEIPVTAVMSNVDGVLTLEHGGTSKNLAPVAGSIVWTDANSMQLSPPGLSGQVLVSNGTEAPGWGSALLVVDQAANLVYAGPESGSPAATAFRALVNADLPNSGATVGTYGSATQVAQVTVNAKGVVTAVADVTVTPAFSSITATPTTLTGYGISDAQPLDGDLSAIAALTGTTGLLKKTAENTWILEEASPSGITAVTATSPLVSSGGTAPDISIPQASGSVAGYLSSADWTTFSNKVSLAGTETLTNKTINLASNTLVATSAQLRAALTDETGSGSAVFATSPTLVTPALGTPSSVTLTNATDLPVSTGVSGLGTGVATFLGTPSSANLLVAVTDGTGTGALVFGTTPTLTTPVLVNPSYSGTTANGGTVTTIDINGGTVDGTVIGGATPAAGTFTTAVATSLTVNGVAITGVPGLAVVNVSATTQTAVKNNQYIMQNVALSTLTLPATPADGDTVAMTVGNGLLTNVIARNGSTIMGLAQDLTVDNSLATVTLRYVNSDWRLI